MLHFEMLPRRLFKICSLSMFQFSKLLTFLFLIIIDLPQPIFCDEDCVYKECYCYDDTVECGSLNLVVLPTLSSNQTDGQYTKLIFRNNPFTTVQSRSLPTNLSYIDFTDVPLEIIDDEAFQRSEHSLLRLDFGHANFSTLPPALGSLLRLTNLSLENTHIESWDVGIISRLSRNLRHLSLRNVGLNSWPHWVSLLPQLETLEMSDSSLVRLPDDAFNNMSKTLLSLTLFDLNLSALPQSLESLVSLKELVLGMNQLTELNHYPNLSQLKVLSLYKNNLSSSATLLNHLLPFVHTLTDLDLNSNLLHSIPELIEFQSLTFLDLRNNLLNDSMTGSFPPNITDLLLDQNLLQAVPIAAGKHTSVVSIEISSNQITVISNIPEQLTSLDISDNLLVELVVDNFPPNSSLTRLVLNKNPLERIASDAFQHLTCLKYINLRETKISRVPLALWVLHDLEYLDLFDNHDLVCTCQESTLVSWFQSRPIMVTNGYCQNLAIWEFYQDTVYECPNVTVSVTPTDVIIG